MKRTHGCALANVVDSFAVAVVVAVVVVADDVRGHVTLTMRCCSTLYDEVAVSP